MAVSWVPDRKVGFGAAVGAVVTLAVWAAHQFAHTDIPSEQASALATLLYFAASYVLPGASDSPPAPSAS